jgi:hypothetical protein
MARHRMAQNGTLFGESVTFIVKLPETGKEALARRHEGTRRAATDSGQLTTDQRRIASCQWSISVKRRPGTKDKGQRTLQQSSISNAGGACPPPLPAGRVTWRGCDCLEPCWSWRAFRPFAHRVLDGDGVQQPWGRRRTIDPPRNDAHLLRNPRRRPRPRISHPGGIQEETSAPDQQLTRKIHGSPRRHGGHGESECRSLSVVSRPSSVVGQPEFRSSYSFSNSSSSS